MKLASFAGAALAVALVGSGCRPAARVLAHGLEPLFFEVTIEGGTLRIEGALPAGVAVSTDDETDAWVSDVEVRVGGDWQPLTARGSERIVPACGAASCAVRYRFDLLACARKVDDPETAKAHAGTIVAPSSSFLLLPRGDSYPAHRFRIHGERFASGAPREGDVFRQDATELTLPVTVFGANEIDAFSVGAASFDVAFVAGPFAVGHAAFVARLRRTVERIAEYDGLFPAPHTLVVVLPTEREHDGDIGGLTLGGGGGASVLLAVPEGATEGDLAHDWVTTHELLHVAFPTVGRPHRWMEEGLSTYLEPVIRVRDGTVDATKFWSDLVDGLPRGLPREGDPGLEHQATWASTYWGGALYWFEVDLDIRRRSHGQRSLRDTLRAVARAGGFVGHRWPLERVVQIGDEGSGVPALRDELHTLGERGAHVDLDPVWRSLGIARPPHGSTLTLDDRAPEASLRARIASGD